MSWQLLKDGLSMAYECPNGSAAACWQQIYHCGSAAALLHLCCGTATALRWLCNSSTAALQQLCDEQAWFIQTDKGEVAKRAGVQIFIDDDVTQLANIHEAMNGQVLLIWYINLNGFSEKARRDYHKRLAKPVCHDQVQELLEDAAILPAYSFRQVYKLIRLKIGEA